VSTERMKTKLKVLTTCNIDPELWLDYVEGEIDPSMKSDLKLHLQNCTTCQKNFSEFKTVRTGIQKTSDPQIPSDEFFKTLELKIMASLDNQVSENHHVASVAVSRVYAYTRQYTKSIAAVAALFLLILGGLYKTMNFKEASSPQVAQSKLEEQFIVQAATNDPEAISEAMISHQDVEDVVMNATAEKLSRMSDRDAAQALKNMR
jgi:anti-sigma factor RsiW